MITYTYVGPCPLENCSILVPGFNLLTTDERSSAHFTEWEEDSIASAEVEHESIEVEVVVNWLIRSAVITVGFLVQPGGGHDWLWICWL